LQEQKKIDERIKARFLDEWLFEDAPNGYSGEFIDRGGRFGIDVTLPRRVLIAEIKDISKYSDSADGQRLIDMINRTVRKFVERGNQNVFAKTPSQMICLFTNTDESHLRAAACEILNQIKNQFSIEIQIGIDKKTPRIYLSYQMAKKALTAGKYTNELIYFYDDITMEIFMDEISEASKKEFLLRMFRGYNEEETAYWVKFLRAYFNSDGSLVKTSAQLFIHKNTVQNKLNSLAKQTGHDPRKTMDAALFVMAVHFYDNIRASEI
jgi:carbohydrate diacid regulator